MPRKSIGRQKIEMTKMSKESNLLVTFSKRRSGLFKKASELSILCGAEIAIIVFSPGKKVFSFGHPCVESILDRFLTRNPEPALGNSGSTLQLAEAHRNANVRQVNTQFAELMNEFEEEKKRGDELNNMKKEDQGKWWWVCPLEGLGFEALQQFKAGMEDLKNNVANQHDNVMAEVTMNKPILGASTSGASTSGNNGGGDTNGVDQFNAPSYGLSMTPHGYTLGYPGGFF